MAKSNTLKRAIAQAPGRIKDINRGAPPKRDKRRFQAYTVSQLLETYRDPRAILLEIAAMDTAKLAAEMHGTLADALAERRLCAQAVLPYVAQKLPVQVDMRHTRAIVLNIVDDRQYEQLVTLDAEQSDTDEGFSIALMQGNSPDLSSNETPADATQQAPQQQQRALQWDITPGNNGSQRKNVTSIDGNDIAGEGGVTPPVPLPHRRAE